MNRKATPKCKQNRKRKRAQRKGGRAKKALKRKVMDAELFNILFFYVYF